MYSEANNIEAINMEIFERLVESKSFEKLSKKYKISKSTLMRYYNHWAINVLESQTMSRKDIKTNISGMGRKTILTAQEEKLISNAVVYYAENLTPISRTEVIDLTETVIEVFRGAKRFRCYVKQKLA